MLSTVKSQIIIDLEHLDRFLKSYNIPRSDICIVGSFVLATNKIRKHGDLDVVVSRSHFNKFKSGLVGNYVDSKINIVKNKYLFLIGIEDEKLISNSDYHSAYNGFKVINLEIEYASKIVRSKEKDLIDIEIIHNDKKLIKKINWDYVKPFWGGYYKLSMLSKFYFIFLRFNRKLINKESFSHFVIKKIKGLINRVIKLAKRLISHENNNYIVKYIDIGTLIALQFNNGKFERYDLIMRLLTAQDGEKFGNEYKIMQMKRWGHQNYKSYLNLMESVKKNGLLPQNPISINKHGKLIDGSHRLALAILNNIDNVPIKLLNSKLHSEYPIEFFTDPIFDQHLVALLSKTAKKVFIDRGSAIKIVVWPLLHTYFGEITSYVESKYSLLKHEIIEINNFENFIRDVYKSDDIEEWKIYMKLSRLLEVKSSLILVLEIQSEQANYRTKHRNNHYLDSNAALIKADLRNRYSKYINDYVYDISLHGADNPMQSRAITRLINQYSEYER